MSTLFPVVIASGFHLFPFRTEKLSPTAPMVLRKRESRSPPPFTECPLEQSGGHFFYVLKFMPKCMCPREIVSKSLRLESLEFEL